MRSQPPWSPCESKACPSRRRGVTAPGWSGIMRPQGPDMKPSKFEYARPASIAETVALVSEADGESALLAGGQSLVPRMNLRVVAPRRIIDLGGVTELRYVEPDGDQVRIGAMTTQESAERSPIVKEA